ncbi:2-amino-4-hydroxy-6-hydroxymethyldihydropteridine diphosphokinase [Paraflavitalea sp. CAU 1676]|uniref:2-amino-4-hydroxy-6- hydroxymethyldihydropteridine diphosphokinase n=1 Tax=Paraflavitalea sp. CAU 1676 TaxID=3032598 RepID=UPI0023DBD43F|nr:2-amino-4-hydroxy-6-hydroxymethyldihydropteridine diphosphokinase [Paraflavitalea sp. CAU 1676]MDF2189946.1 2-amino-4-hydroxy-6-hydroxymethyldihydropteridine diphosphokinase [Paraflavitalea sp. CAU 1676]
MNKAYLLIGGNVGNRQQNLHQAVKAIDERCGSVRQQSALYETAAWGKTDQQAFLNQALRIETHFSAPELLHHVLEVETSLGRVRDERYGPRIIDIDIIFFNNDIIDLPSLTIPHPEVQNRRFALAPLEEIAPQLMHPVLHKSIHQLLLECPDTLEVQRLKD